MTLKKLKQPNNPHHDLQVTKTLILEIIQKSGIADKRSRHLDVTDFLRLLKLFNDRGFHFK